MTAQEQREGVIRPRNRANTLSGDNTALKNLATQATSGAPSLSHLLRLECDFHGETHFLSSDLCCIRCEQEWQRLQLQQLKQLQQQQTNNPVTNTTITTISGSDTTTKDSKDDGIEVQNEYQFGD